MIIKTHFLDNSLTNFKAEKIAREAANLRYGNNIRSVKEGGSLNAAAAINILHNGKKRNEFVMTPKKNSQAYSSCNTISQLEYGMNKFQIIAEGDSAIVHCSLLIVNWYKGGTYK